MSRAIRIAVRASLASVLIIAYAASSRCESVDFGGDNISRNWQERAAVFSAFEQHMHSPRVSPGKFQTLPLSSQEWLLKLLRAEIQFQRQGGPSLASSDDESYSDYFSSLIEFVSHIGTIDASHLLLEPEILVTGSMATDGVAAMGHAVLPEVVQRYDSPPVADALSRGLYRLSIVFVMNKMVARSDVTQNDRARLEQALLAASRDRSGFVRSASLKGLGYFKDDEALARIREMTAISPIKTTK